ncbi:uncharacterized protein BYT42DRAFT_582474 [Radiomyces spectabilis]|uniref:uncharacterized protein n=1 Tax=Radiomyces spectabilis TaxID=64574 RepID=UPI00221E9971|nr:uncharacterized protein BYT42DRAFT_582474 [Radiomyces spectabilis]KAI8370449.1 hypothetical protein BYT42DRAFT_582474 [Radiomyces spectabilis]
MLVNYTFRSSLGALCRQARYCRLYTTGTPVNAEPITTDDSIHRLDLRIGKIVQIDHHPNAEHLYVERVDVAESEPRTIVSGLAKYIPKDSLINKHVVVVCNMKSSRFRGILSQGMLLAASHNDQVALLEPTGVTLLGERVQVKGVTMGTPDTVLKPKQKVIEQVMPHLQVKSGIATYKNKALVTGENHPVTCDIDGQVS